MALDDKYIIRRIQNHVDRAINSEEGDVTQLRQAMYSRYMGDLYGNEREGYSKFTTREVLQAIEWALPALLRVFYGGIRAVEFLPNHPGDEDQAAHETEVVNYWFFENGDAFLTVYSIIKDLLMYPNGYLQVFHEEEEDTTTESFEGVNDAQIDAFDEMPDVAEITIEKEYAEAASGEKLYDISVMRKRTLKQIRVAPIPPDHCLVEHNHHSLNLDASPFVCIREQKTHSDLREMGYTADDLEDLAPDDDDTWNDEAVTRYFYEDEQPGDSDSAFDIKADELYWVHVCYMRVDHNEDGISEPRRIVMVGCKILENEDMDYQPAISGTAMLQTHKHIGMGYAEIVADLQLLQTTLTRQLLDNIYKKNVQRYFVNDAALLSDGSTMDAILDGRSEVISVRGLPQEAVMPEQVDSIVAEIAAVIEKFAEEPAKRTGVAPEISLDPSVLEKSTMGAFVGALDQASQRLELLARLIAEAVLKPAFQKIHYLLRTYFDDAQPLYIKGKWVQPKPSTWKKRPNMRTNVGLGFNNKQMMMTLLTTLLQIQEKAFTQGLADHKTIYNTMEKLVDQMNLGHAGTYFVDPKQDGWKAPEPKPDAAMIAAQAQAEALKAEAQRKDKEIDAKIAADAKKLEAEIAANAEKANAEAMKGNQALMGHKLEVRKAEDERALNASVITKNNRDDKAQGGPSEDSSADEYAFASSSISGKGNGKSKSV